MRAAAVVGVPEGPKLSSHTSSPSSLTPQPGVEGSAPTGSRGQTTDPDAGSSPSVSPAPRGEGCAAVERGAERRAPEAEARAGVERVPRDKSGGARVGARGGRRDRRWGDRRPSRRASSESEAAARRSLRRRESLARRRASNERRGSDAVGSGRGEAVPGGDALGSSRSRASHCAHGRRSMRLARSNGLWYPIDGSANQTPPFRRKSSKIFPPFKSTGEDDRSTRNSKLKKESSPVTDAEISAVE